MLGARATLVLFSLCLAAAVRAQSPYRLITVRVSDAQTHAPLPGVQVTLQGVVDREWSTEPDGKVLVGVPSGTRAVLLLRRIGYAPLSVTIAAAAGEADVRAEMEQSVTMLDTAKVVGDARSQMFAGFDRRRMIGAGSASFITREQIDKQMALRTVDIIRRAIGARVVDSLGILQIASSRGPKTISGGAGRGAKAVDLAPCIMRTAVDGVMMPPDFQVNDIEPGSIHGVEIYSGPATVPSEFGGLRKDAICGLVMIWTRRGP